mgnify:CR=1 FL=1
MTQEYIIDTTPLLANNQAILMQLYGGTYKSVKENNGEIRLQNMNATLREYKQKVHADKIRILDIYFRHLGNKELCKITPEVLNKEQINHFLTKINRDLSKYAIINMDDPANPKITYSSQFRLDGKEYDYDNVFAVKNNKYNLLYYLYWYDLWAAFVTVRQNNPDARKLEEICLKLIFIIIAGLIIIGIGLTMATFNKEKSINPLYLIVYLFIVISIILYASYHKVPRILEFVYNEHKIEKYRNLLSEDIFEYKA